MTSSRHTSTLGRFGKAVCMTTVLALLFSMLTVLTTNVGLASAGKPADYAVRTFIDSQGREVAEVMVAGKPPKTKMGDVELPQPDVESGINTLSDVPAFDWSYGCSATSAAMLFGYYDRTGYANMYTGSTDGGVCPLDNSIWGETSYSSVTCHECPLSAAHEGIDGQVIRGHVDDYWIDYGNSASDPYIVNGWTEHSATSTGDFMGTSQSKFYNNDGSTMFYYYPNGDPLYDYTACEPNDRDASHGMRLFAESRGYTVVTNFSQLIQGQASDPNKGFTFDDFKAEIDAGRPAIIHVVGHTMLGIGYDTTGSVVYLRDTWDHSTHQMTWGGTYSGRQMKYVTVIRLAVSASPAVTTNDATSITNTTARLNGNLTSLGTSGSVTVSFVWGTSSGSYPNETTGQARAATGAFYFDLGSLNPGTTYYFKAKAVGNGTAYGVEKSFTTGTMPPAVTTNDATSITNTTARLNGNLTSLGTSGSVTVSFVWGTSSGTYTNETTGQAKTATGTYYSDLGSLNPGTTYYYQAKAVGNGTSYGVEKSFTTGTTPPAVTTNDATSITNTTARLNGNLTSLGTSGSVTVSFVWGTSSGSYPNETTGQARTATGTYYSDLGSLNPGTTYYFKAKAVGNGTSYGVEKSFTTGTVPPAVTTNDATSITNTTARLNGNLTSLGTSGSVTVSFVWGTSSGSYPNETTGQARTATGTYYSDLGSLNPGTTYYVKAKAVGNGTSYGVEKSFTTGTTPPAVTTNDANNIGTTSGRLNGNLTALGTAGSVTVSFVWGTSSGSYPNETTGQARTATGTYYSDLGSLNPGTTYYFKAKAVGNGTSYGVEKSFTTGTTPPAVTTNDANNIGTTSGRLNGNLTALGTAGSVTVSFVWGITPGSYTNETTGQAKTAIGTYYFDLGSLTPGTTYYYQAKAVGNGTSYGMEKSFTTGTIPPAVATNDASSIIATGARLNGNLTSLGTASSVTVSFVWGTTPGPYTNETTGQAKTATGTYYFDLGSLTPGTTYYYQAKAVGNGTAYGAEKSFTTGTTPPAVTTNDATNIGITSACLNGNLTSLGTASSVTVSLMWGTISGSYLNETIGQDMAGTGTFYFDLGSLTPGATYYYQAKAVGNGTAYGAEKSFTTGTTPPIVTTNDATSVGTTSARLDGNLTSLGTAGSVTVSFVWGITPGSYTNETTGQAKTATGTFHFDLGSLNPGTTYYYQAKAVGNGTAYGAEKSFTTSAATASPSTTTNAATRVKSTGAVLNGYLGSLGSASTVYVSFEWGTSPGVYDHETALKVRTSAGSFSSSLTGLTAGTTYYFRAKGVGDGTAYGEERIFTAASSVRAKTSKFLTALMTPETAAASGEEGSAFTAAIVGPWERFVNYLAYCLHFIVAIMAGAVAL